MNKQQSGTVLINAMLIATLCAVISTVLITSQQYLIRQASLVINFGKLYLYLQGVQDWAGEVILKRTDLQKNLSFEKNFHRVHITGKIYAQGGLFNINALTQWKNLPRFIRLLQVVMPNLSIDQDTDIATEINQWLTPNHSDNYYLHLNPPRRAAHRLMVNISELRAVRGVTAKIYEALKPYITALPNSNYEIDINYAPIPVLMTLEDNITLPKADVLQSCRKEHGLFRSVADYLKVCGDGLLKDRQNITTEEKYYLVQGRATFNEQELTLVSMISSYVTDSDKNNYQVLWQQVENF